MSITLTLEQEQFIQEQLKTGKYQSANEVITEAFRLLETRDKSDRQWVEEVREKVKVAIASLERGGGRDGEEVVAELLEKFRKAREDRG